MGEFVSKNFVAAYQQAGDFEVVNIGGNVQKNGGNVATCFCTPDARVVHAVGGPVSGERMLREASWAVEKNQALNKIPRNRWQERADFLHAAHLGALNVSPEQFQRKTRERLPQAQIEYVKKRQEYRDWRGKGDRQPPLQPVDAAMRQAAKSLGGDRAHQILATAPLGTMAQLEERLFEELTGEKFAEARGRVYLAADGMKRARENKLPVLLVLYKGQGKNRDEYNKETEFLLTTVFRQRSIHRALTSYVVIAMPLRELAALTQLAELPTINLTSKAATNLVVLDIQGKQTASLNPTASLDQLESALWPQLHGSMIARAESLAENDNLPGAVRLLRRILGTPADKAVIADAKRRIQQYSLQLARMRADEGRKLEALRLARRVQIDAFDDELRRQASQQLTAFRAEP